MARLTAWLVILLTAMTGLAGCAGAKAGVKETEAEVQSTVSATGEAAADAGSIEGFVTDDALIPIPGASVAVLELSLTATTDDTGAFAFTNLAPGKYGVAAAALGYDSASKNVDVRANEASRVSFSLEPLEIKEPYALVLGPYSAFLECTFGTPNVAGSCPNNVTAGGQTITLLPNVRNTFRFKMLNETEAFVGELRWQPSAYGTSRSLALTFSYSARTSFHWWCRAGGSSPIYNLYLMDGGCQVTGSSSASQLPSNEPQKPNVNLTLQYAISSPFGSVNTGNPAASQPVYLTLQQRAEAIITLFQDGVPPDGYTAFPDR